MRNKIHVGHVAPLFLLLGSIASCWTGSSSNPVPPISDSSSCEPAGSEAPPSCGAEPPSNPVLESQAHPPCETGAPPNPVAESKAHLYCPGYENPEAFVQALMAGAVLPAGISPCFPLDVDESLPAALNRGRMDQAIRQLDTFGWQMFIALSWPVERRGTNLHFAPSLDGQGAPRWRGWITADEVFARKGGVPKACQPASNDMLDTSLSLFSKHMKHQLWDQQGKPVGFEIVMNQPVHNIIDTHHLNTPEGQIENPDAVFGWTDVKSGGFGSAIVKLAWKELGEQDQADRFFRRVARTPGDSMLREFGLVGMHIAYKLSYLKGRWVWITFEHIDNVNDEDEPACAPPAPPPREEPLFYDKQCRPEDCPANDPRSKNPRLGPEGRATQVVREHAIEPETVEFNCEMRALLHERAPGSPAQYYKLIAAQAAFTGALGNKQFVPLNALNTVLETYQQKDGVGCWQCHQVAPLDAVWMLTSKLRADR